MLRKLPIATLPLLALLVLLLPGGASSETTPPTPEECLKEFRYLDPRVAEDLAPEDCETPQPGPVPKPKPKPEPELKPVENQKKVASPRFQRIPISSASLDNFPFPPFLLPIYQSCGTHYNVPWTLLAAINRVETDFGRNLNVSTAGAVGWMQFMPSTWEAYGVDANRDKKKDPYSPVDAICAAASYLKASGVEDDMPGAVFSYNHASWYVDEVLALKKSYDELPSELIASLSGLAAAEYAPIKATRFGRWTSQGGLPLRSDPGSALRATNDSIVEELQKTGRVWRVTLRDPFGNRYIFENLSEVPERVTRDASPNMQLLEEKKRREMARPTLENLERLMKGARRGLRRLMNGERPIPFKEGETISSGTVIGWQGSRQVKFRLRPLGARPAGINPAPIFAGWKILEKNRFRMPSGSKALMMSKLMLEDAVLRNKKLDIYSCGRQDIESGRIDRRILALLQYLTGRGYRLGVSSLQCGHSMMTASGNVSNHYHGSGVDIYLINGEPVLGNQQKGSLTQRVLEDVLQLQGNMQPDELISLFDLGGPSFALADHDDHIHVGYSFYKSGPTSTLRRQDWDRLSEGLSKIEMPRGRSSGD